MKKQPDEMAATARRWVTSHRGPRTKAVTAVLEALSRYYDDLIVVHGIVQFGERQR